VDGSAIAAARARWRAAEDRLYPTLIADPTTYQRALGQVHAVLDELRRRCGDPSALLDAEAEEDDLVAAACPHGPVLPGELLVGVACGLRDRELRALAERERVAAVVEAARSRGDEWASLRGPERIDELIDGESVALHVASGAVLSATVDPWSGEPPYRLEWTPPTGEATTRMFADRDVWLAEYRRMRS
jgi:hypothetical protein